MKNWKKNIAFDLTAVLLGVALTFAFAPYEVFPLAIFALAGLMALWHKVTPGKAFERGFFFGLGLFGAGIYWIYISVHIFGDVPYLLSAIITGGFIALLAFCPAIVGYLSNRFFVYNNTTKLITAIPAIWVLIEWIRSWFCSGFPWLMVGYTQTNSPLKGYAPLLGVFSVSLCVLLTSAFIVNAILQYRQKEYRSAYFNLLAFLLLWIGGSLFSLIPWTKPQGEAVPVSLVQGGIPQEIKWSLDYLQLSLDRYENMSDSSWSKNKLIIWPEGAIPLFLQDASAYINKMDKKARESGAHLILGIPIQAGLAYYNSIITVGEQRQIYLKRHLVPFGEYTPLKSLIVPLLRFFNIPMFDELPGKLEQKPFQVGDLKILASICYEITFPELMNFTDKEIGLLLTVTNDAWFGRSAAQAQHLQMAAMRAIEVGRPVIMVSNDGITAIIGPKGNIEAQAPPYRPYVLNGIVQPTYGLTPWMRNGMDPLLFLLLFLLVVGQFANIREKALYQVQKPSFANPLDEK